MKLECLVHSSFKFVVDMLTVVNYTVPEGGANATVGGSGSAY